MRRGFYILLILSAADATALAQRSHGYIYIAPGGVSGAGGSGMTLHLGGGGEFLLAKRVGVGVELGALGPRRSYVDSVVGVGSVNGSYHFKTSSEKIDPFVTAGYSLGFRTGTINFFNFGGGINYWFLSRLGLKLEIRDHVASPNGGAVHFWGVRFGLAF